MRWMALPLLGVLLMPLLFSVLVSFTPSRYLELPRGQWTLDWYRHFFRSPLWTEALMNSVAIAALSALIAVPVAMATALVLARAHFAWSTLAERALLVPMVLPNVALAAGMLAVVRMTPLWGSHAALAMAHSVLAVPAAYLVLRASLRQVDPNLEAAARGLGASSWNVFRFVTLPLILPAVLAATVFTLAISLNEITLALFLATRYTETLPRVIWPHLRFAISPLVAAASVILLVLTVPGLAAAAWWLRPRSAGRSD